MSGKRNKKEYEQLKGEEWIQMDDLNDPHNQNLSRKFAKEQGKKYEQKPVIPKSHPINSIQSSHNAPNNRSAEPVPKRQPINNKQNERIQAQSNRRIKKPSIPLMLVTCEYCTVSQNVPGNTQVYTCGSCQNMNECEPLYGVFNCGNCQVKVCYGFGISVMVKCPKCKSINKVPAEPVKKYETGPRSKPQIPPRQKEEELQVERPEKINLGYQQQVYQEEGFQYPGVE